jgi:hypothetical protein
MFARRKPRPKKSKKNEAVPNKIRKVVFEDPAPAQKSEVKLGFERGKETRTYTPARALTGDKRYGKESPEKEDPKFIEDARSAKQDIAYKDGKPYRAGFTSVTKEPDKFTTKIDVHPKISKIKVIEEDAPKASNKKSAAEIRQTNGPGRKRRLKRVPWLPGQNKRTESGYGPG